MSEFHTLSWSAVAEAYPMVVDDVTPDRIDWHELGERVIDDFTRKAPLQVRDNTTLGKAETLLKTAKARYACVLNSNDELIGVVALRDFHSRKAVQLGQQTHTPWHDVLVSELMTPLRQLPQVEVSRARRARIGDLAATLQASGRDFIVLHNDGKVAGLVSSLRIAQLTGESVNVYHTASSFAEILTAVNHSDTRD
ncbi:hypothetical protein CWI84_00465 [Idiomarina tyrosinivorans]|uniref:CBS domain-containing protein n=1 Tax=Idiomarina tyrosinivorans TaxID=1445662 RepID=A0A432ZTQ5_9GAMM|nr:CBS domain-containing protein [Idiomarina tyrosinivorans]RUO81269.1 hypothetical protein CWI84_00465 [Idiomarina tyrosinivorans]